MTAIQEYDLEFKPVTIVRGQGLCKLAAEAPDPIDSGEEGWEKEISMYAQEILSIPTDTGSWYNELR